MKSRETLKDRSTYYAINKIIDNPQVMREVIAKNHPCFTHPGAEEIYGNRTEDMDRYANTYAGLADTVWREQYQDTEQSGREVSLSQSSTV